MATGEDEITITPTTSLTAKENRIYAKAGSLCSASGADYTYTSGADRIAGDGEEISTDRTPTLTVGLLANGDEVSVHKSADCSDTALASGTATGGESRCHPFLLRFGHSRPVPQTGRRVPPEGIRLQAGKLYRRILPGCGGLGFLLCLDQRRWGQVLG